MLENENWTLGRLEGDQRVLLVRSRQLDASFSFRTHPERLTVLWTYRECDDEGGITADEVQAMSRFEVLLYQHCENTNNAVLTLVLTDLDSSQYVLYARDATELMRALQQIPSEAEPYPIRVQHEHDPDGSVHRFYAAKLAAH